MKAFLPPNRPFFHLHPFISKIPIDLSGRQKERRNNIYSHKQPKISKLLLHLQPNTQRE
jgi:hypothetical protein